MTDHRTVGAEPAYAELHAHSAFSFLDGASQPEDLVYEAARLGLRALALTDHDGLYGVVRFAQAARDGRAADGVRCRAPPPGPRRRARRADRSAGPSSHPPAGPRARSRRLPGAVLGDRRGAPGHGDQGRCPLPARRARRCRSWPVARAHRLPQGRRPAGARAARPSRPGRTPGHDVRALGAGPADGALRPRQRGRRDHGHGRPVGLRPQRRARRAGSRPPACRWSRPATSTTPPPPTPTCAVRSPPCVPGRAWTTSTGGCPGGPATTYGPRPRCSPDTAGIRRPCGPPPSWPLSARSTCTWSPRTCRPTRCHPVMTRRAGCASSSAAARTNATARPTPSGCPVRTRRSRTSST